MMNRLQAAEKRYANLKYIWLQDREQINVLVDALKHWRDMFEWGDFLIDFSNGVTHNGIDEGQVKGGKMLKEMIEETKQALALVEGNTDASTDAG